MTGVLGSDFVDTGLGFLSFLELGCTDGTHTRNCAGCCNTSNNNLHTRGHVLSVHLKKQIEQNVMSHVSGQVRHHRIEYLSRLLDSHAHANRIRLALGVLGTHATW